MEETKGVFGHLSISAKGLRFAAGLPLEMKQLVQGLKSV